jgi:hypothetical protein
MSDISLPLIYIVSGKVGGGVLLSEDSQRLGVIDEFKF